MGTEPTEMPLRCRLLGHDLSFTARGSVLVWECRRSCGAAGSKTYDSARDAVRFAAAFDRRAGADLGRNAPLLGMFPLRLWHWWRSRR
jgi:hypothetical protein